MKEEPDQVCHVSVDGSQIVFRIDIPEDIAECLRGLSEITGETEGYWICFFMTDECLHLSHRSDGQKTITRGLEGVLDKYKLMYWMFSRIEVIDDDLPYPESREELRAQLLGQEDRGDPPEFISLLLEAEELVHAYKWKEAKEAIAKCKMAARDLGYWVIE